MQEDVFGANGNLYKAITIIRPIGDKATDGVNITEIYADATTPDGTLSGQAITEKLVTYEHPGNIFLGQFQHTFLFKCFNFDIYHATTKKLAFLIENQNASYPEQLSYKEYCKSKLGASVAEWKFQTSDDGDGVSLLYDDGYRIRYELNKDVGAFLRADAKLLDYKIKGDPESYTERKTRLLTADQTAQALAIFEQAFKMYQRGDFGSAKIRFEQGLDINPSVATAHYYLAEALMRFSDNPQGFRDIALASYHYQQVIKLSPNSNEAAESQAVLLKLKQGLNLSEFSVH